MTTKHQVLDYLEQEINKRIGIINNAKQTLHETTNKHVEYSACFSIVGLGVEALKIFEAMESMWYEDNSVNYIDKFECNFKAHLIEMIKNHNNTLKSLKPH